jgi:histidinol-phosphate aminotransferase
LEGPETPVGSAATRIILTIDPINTMSLPFATNPVLTHLPVYQPGRPIEEVARELGLDPATVIKLASNENPLGPSRLAKAAMKKALDQLHLYPDGSAFYLKEKLAARLQVTTANLVLGNGSNEVIELLGHALLSAESEVVVSQYCFAVYPIVTALFGARLVTVPARNYSHDLDAMLAAITPRTRIVFLANPNNPTGTVVPRADLERFVAAVPENVVIAMDEAYIEFLADAPDFLAEIRAGRKPNLILMRTFSKIYGLAGVRLGYGIAHPEFIAELEKIRQPFHINAIAQAAAIAALEDTAHAAKTKKNNERGLKLYARTFKKLGLEFVRSAGNFILVRVGEGQKVFAELQKLGVIVRPMGGYQLGEWIRISVGTPKENQRCLEALATVLGKTL